MNRRRNLIFVLAFMMLALLVCVSCASAKKPVQPAPKRTSYQSPNVRTTQPATPQPPTPTTPGVPATLADTIVNEVVKMSGVKSAHVLVVGTTAFVGVNLDRELDDKKFTTLKDTVSNKVKKFSRINEALVSADPEIVEQIRDISQGKSTPDSIGDLYTRLKPQR